MTFLALFPLLQHWAAAIGADPGFLQEGGLGLLAGGCGGWFIGRLRNLFGTGEG